MFSFFKTYAHIETNISLQYNHYRSTDNTIVYDIYINNKRIKKSIERDHGEELLTPKIVVYHNNEEIYFYDFKNIFNEQELYEIFQLFYLIHEVESKTYKVYNDACINKRFKKWLKKGVLK